MENKTPAKKFPAYAVLAIIALVAAVVLAVTNMVTKGPIAEHAAAALKEAFGAVMPADSYEQITVPAGYDGVSALYAAKTGDQISGYCVTAAAKGYNGDVAVTLGVGTDGLVTGCVVGDNNFAESAGFGQRAKEPAFQEQFQGIDAVNGGTFEALSGATVTSTAVLNATNAALKCVDEVALQKTAAADPIVSFGKKEATATQAPAALTGDVRRGTAKGFQSDVSVELTLGADGTISALTIDASGETAGMGQRTMEDADFQKQFIGKTGPFTLGTDVDALSGATITSTAVVDAVNGALAAPAAAAAGETLTGTAKGFQSDVTVKLTMDGDAIAALTIDASGETAGMGQRTMEDADFQKQFIGKTAPLTLGGNIDALSGATITSTAVVDAANAALATAGAASSGAETATATELAKDDNATLGVLPDGSATVSAASAFSGTVDATLTVENGKVTAGTVASKLPSTAARTDDGAFTATAKGFTSDVRATLTLNADGTIATLKLGTAKETEYIGQDVAKNADFINQFLGKTAPFAIGEGIDAVSGATYTSKGIVAAINDAVAFALANGGTADVATATDAAAAASTAAPAAAGATLTGTAKGFESDVKVTVTVDADGKITALTIDASGETAGIGQRTMEDKDFQAQFIGKTIPLKLGEDVDALSGATFTSTGVVDAINSAAAATDAAAGATLTGTAKGFESDVKVTVTVDADGKITALTIDASGETAGIGQRTMEDKDFQAQFIGKTIPLKLGEDVDALSGATFTSTGVVDAINSAK